MQLFPLLRDWGATGLLIEWEDTFPYTRELSAIGSKGPGNRGGAYSVVEAKQILQLANDNGLIVIPLVQTFGHLEVFFFSRANISSKTLNYNYKICI